MKALKAFVIGGALLFAAAPALAQDSNYKYGPYQDVSAIEVLPGQFENYMDWLAANWKKQQEFAKSKGWITNYSVLSNNYRRAGEPNLYLVIEYPRQYTNAELEAQDKAFEAFLKMDARQMSTASGERGVMRKQLGSMQLQELKLK